MINPVIMVDRLRGSERTKQSLRVAADVYAARRTRAAVVDVVHGSGRWMYRLIVESLLGLRLEVDKLHVEPCLLLIGEGFTVTTGTGRLPTT